MNTNKTMKQLVAVALVIGASATADAGKGGSAKLIEQAIAANSQGAIISEVERTETLECAECVPAVQSLLTDNRYPVREVAAWWFAKRPGMQQALAKTMEASLTSGDSVSVRNAADFLGTTKEYKAIPLLDAAIQRAGLTSDAKIALVRAAGVMAHTSADGILAIGMSDTDPTVRAAAITAWRDVLGQTDVTLVEGHLADTDPSVRAVAATVVGGYRDANAIGQLERLVTTDASAQVRRNAAWALGKIGSSAAAPALQQAAQDATPTVASVAQAALASLH